MTVVNPQVYGAEKLVYYFLKNCNYVTIEKKLSKTFPNNLRIMYDSLIKQLNPYENFLFPNNVIDPESIPQNSWFDLESNSDFGINVKFGYESSANSRIRDITSFAVEGMNSYLLQNKILPIEKQLSYNELRNIRLHRIFNKTKNNENPRVDEYDILYLKISYLFCLNLIEGGQNTDNILFVKFKYSGECDTFLSKSPKRSFLIHKFLKDVHLIFSENTRQDPHKQTVKYYLKNKYIGFMEIRSNKRLMLHLRFNMDHWKNLKSTIMDYYVKL